MNFCSSVWVRRMRKLPEKERRELQANTRSWDKGGERCMCVITLTRSRNEWSCIFCLLNVCDSFIERHVTGIVAAAFYSLPLLGLYPLLQVWNCSQCINEGFHFYNVVGFLSESFLVKFCAVNRVLCAEKLSEVSRLFSWDFEKGMGSSAPACGLWL